MSPTIAISPIRYRYCNTCSFVGLPIHGRLLLDLFHMHKERTLSSIASRNSRIKKSILHRSYTLSPNLDDGHNSNKLDGLRLLVVDRNIQIRKACGEIAETVGFIVTEADGPSHARQLLGLKDIAILLLDMTYPESGSQSLLEQAKLLYPKTLVITMSAGASISGAVDTMRLGACDYLSKPFPLNILTDALNRAAGRWHFAEESRLLQQTLAPKGGMVDALGQSIEMEKLYRTLSNISNSVHPVMILGETGTGKTLVAHSIHSNGSHGEKPFVSLDCASLGPDLLEGALFGYPKHWIGKTDIQSGGLLASVQGGTVFLDEIGDLPLDLQGRLMAALRDREIRPNSGSKTVRISVRIVAATSRDLTQMVREGLFRMDLYRLLSVVNLRIPPLRGRPDDIAFLTQRFLEKIQRQTGLTHTLSDETLEMLETYDWPDNVRELEDTLARACSQSSESELKPIHLPQKLLRFQRDGKSDRSANLSGHEDTDEWQNKQTVVPIAKLEQRAILGALRETNGDKLKASHLLGIGKTTLYRKLKEYGFSETFNIDEAPTSSDIVTNSTQERAASVCA
jgi:DNA-binding NtrC family response regulator